VLEDPKADKLRSLPLYSCRITVVIGKMSRPCNDRVAVLQKRINWMENYSLVRVVYVYLGISVSIDTPFHIIKHYLCFLKYFFLVLFDYMAADTKNHCIESPPDIIDLQHLQNPAYVVD
jgi:hypothetical protein